MIFWAVVVWCVLSVPVSLMTGKILAEVSSHYPEV